MLKCYNTFIQEDICNPQGEVIMEKNILSPVSIYALGGLGEVGKNMYCLENDEQIIIIDCGVLFPGLELPGVDYVLPDFTHLKNNRNKVKALFITHGHEDHIGGIPFLIKQINVPVIYAPRLAAALIKHKLEDFRINEKVRIVEYDSDTILNINSFKVSFFRVTHSIPDSFGICVDTSEGRIVTTGDFKIDLTPIGKDIELAKIARLGEEGVDLLLSDSTNAENEGYTPSEKNVLDSINDIFDVTHGRLIVSTFSSNISRIQQICEVASGHNRKIAIIGRSMEKSVEISRAFGYIKIPDDTIIPTEDIKKYKNEDLVIICTGSQGEPMAALSRIANGGHKDVTIVPGDTVVFSSSAIPGNGIMIDKIVNLLTRLGAEVITNSILSDIHSSGHPAKQELRLMLKLMKPKYFMPVHGEYRMLRLHGELATTVGVTPNHVFLLDNGDTLVLSKHQIRRDYPLECGEIYIDGKDINGMAPQIINERKALHMDGMMVVALSIDTITNTIINGPEIFCKGIIFQNVDKMVLECKNIINIALTELLKKKTNFNDLKSTIKDVVTEYFFEKTRRKPIIIPVIMSAE